MAIQTPSCCDSEWQLLYKILQSLPDIGGGSDIIVEDEGIVLTTAVTSFDFVGAGVTATAVGNDVTVTISGASTDIQAGSQAIGAGVETISVVFPVAFSVAPAVIASMSRPVAENLLFVNIDEASITVNGFTATISGITESANYRLKWMAK